MRRVSTPMTKSLGYRRINMFMEVVHEKSVSCKIKYGAVLCSYKYSHSALMPNYSVLILI